MKSKLENRTMTELLELRRKLNAEIEKRQGKTPKKHKRVRLVRPGTHAVRTADSEGRCGQRETGRCGHDNGCR